MVFASLEFLTLFLPLFFLAYLLTPQRGRNFTLLVGSWVFFTWWTPRYLVLLIALTTLAFAAALAIERCRSELWRTRIMALAITLNLLCLCWYKYANMLVLSLLELLHHQGVAIPAGFAWESVALPIGLSFTVLHAISYLVDVRRGVVRAQTSFIAFSAYMAMFGHLIAGPIVRYKVIEKELRERQFHPHDFAMGVRRFMVGFSMKVLIADTLSPLVAQIFSTTSPSFVDAWSGCIAYTLQLYFDFAGYSAMAIGLGLMLGFYFQENFNQPYLASSIQDFWRRWHMTLSSWLRDYLYISLGGSRGGNFFTYRNLMLTMAIGGLWHGGESWNFLIWGIIHGTALCVERVCTQRGLSLPDPLARGLTLLTVMLAWTVFRADGFAAACSMWGGQFGLHGWGLSDTLALSLTPVIKWTVVVGIVCVIYPAFPWYRTGVPGFRTEWWRSSWKNYWPVLTFAYALAVLSGQSVRPFLYFQF